MSVAGRRRKKMKKMRSARTPAASASLLTWRRASRLSRPLRMMLNFLKKSRPNRASLTFPTCASNLQTPREILSATCGRAGKASRVGNTQERQWRRRSSLAYRRRHRGFGLPDVLFPKEKLAVEVGQLDRVHVDHLHKQDDHRSALEKEGKKHTHKLCSLPPSHPPRRL